MATRSLAVGHRSIMDRSVWSGQPTMLPGRRREEVAPRGLGILSWRVMPVSVGVGLQGGGPVPSASWRWLMAVRRARCALGATGRSPLTRRAHQGALIILPSGGHPLTGKCLDPPCAAWTLLVATRAHQEARRRSAIQVARCTPAVPGHFGYQLLRTACGRDRAEGEGHIRRRLRGLPRAQRR